MWREHERTSKKNKRNRKLVYIKRKASIRKSKKINAKDDRRADKRNWRNAVRIFECKQFNEWKI